MERFVSGFRSPVSGLALVGELIEELRLVESAAVALIGGQAVEFALCAEFGDGGRVRLAHGEIGGILKKEITR